MNLEGSKGLVVKPTIEYGAELGKEDFKFSAAHFTVFGPERAEGLHGHNYRVRVELWGPQLNELGFLADFAEVKSRIRELCARWDEKILMPSEAPYLRIEQVEESLEIEYAERRYRVPAEETELLPVSNITVEALAHLFWRRFADTDCLCDSSVSRVRVSIAETSGQGASFSASI